MKIDIDNHKLMYHPERVAEWRQKGDCFPIYVEIGPTNRCNHRCKFCALDFLKHGGVDINPKVLKRNLEDMASKGVKSVMFAGEGEPLLYKHISEIVKTAKEKGIDVSITSNGSPFNEEKAGEILPYVSWIRFSVDAGTKEIYAKIHGTKEEEFDRVIQNIKYAVELKKIKDYGATIGVQATLLSENAGEIETLARLVKGIGVDNIQIKPYSHHPSSNNDLTPDYRKLTGLKDKLKQLEDKKFSVFYREKTIERVCNGINYENCLGLPFFALIDCRGNVIPCNLFYNQKDFQYGNINEHSFSDIWRSERRQEVLRKIKEKGVEDCRIGCRLDVINRYLDRVLNPGPHDNFI